MRSSVHRRCLRMASFLGAAGLSTLALAPALAAAPVSQAGANALEVSVAGQGNGTGTVTATNDGSRETVQGQANPPISVLKGQRLLNLGVLAQEATARGDSTSAACAGIAGEGGSVAQVGDSSCLRPGQPVGLSVTNLDFSKVLVIDPESALGPLAQANEPLRQVLTQVTDPLREGIQDTPLGTTGITGTAGAIEGRCTARPGAATGAANIVDGRLDLSIADQTVTLVHLPAHPAPNTHVPVQLDKATGVIIDAVETQLKDMLAEPGATGPLAPLAALPQALQDQVITALVDATRDQLLQPLQDNVLHLVLNKQTRQGADHIQLSAFDLGVLPAARSQLGADLAQVQIGNVACGPNGAAPAPQKQARPKAKAPAAMPTAVSAGYESAPGTHVAGEDSGNGVVLGAFGLLLAGAAGLAGIRRLRD